MISIDEINKLKAENATYKANADAVHKYITQNEQLKTHIAYIEKKNAKLKAENEKLKARKDKYYQQTLDDEIKLNELYQTLQEIKTIAEDAYENESEYQATGVYNEIIQKITKAEEEWK